MGRVRQWLAGGVWLALLPSIAGAQTAATSFDQLGSVLESGRRVAVIDANDEKTIGTVAEITSSSLTLLVRDRWGSITRRTFDQASVSRVQKSDRLWNGLLIGIAAGFAATEIWVQQECGGRSSDAECAAIVTAVGWVTMVPSGATAGALIDKFIGNDVVYRAGVTRTNVNIRPFVTPGTKGIALSVRF